MPNPITVEHSIWIAAPRGRVWHAITDPAHLTIWWPPDHWDIPSLEVGATLLYGFHLDIAPVTITTLNPQREFAVCAEPCSFHPSFAPTTAFTLADERNGTRITLIESGYEFLPDPCREFRMSECTNGYQSVLENLKTYLELADVQPPIAVAVCPYRLQLEPA